MMTDLSLPEPTAVPWQDKPIDARDARKGRQPGLSGFLDRVRQRPYVTAIETQQFFPGLVTDTDFAVIPGDPACLEGWYTAFAEQSTTRFRVLTTARTEAEQWAALRDLRERLLDR